MTLPFNPVNELLMVALYVCSLLGSRLIGNRSRGGWLALIAASSFGVVLNASLRLYSGVVFGVVNLAMNVRGYRKWKPQEKTG